MNDKYYRDGNTRHLHDCQHTEHRRVPSSFRKHDTGLLFNRMAITAGDTFLDLGCGAGDYSLHAAKLVGESGTVYAFDISRNAIDALDSEVSSRQIKNIHPLACDICQHIDVPNSNVDVCLIATVLHTFRPTMEEAMERTALFPEIKRVLKPTGKLAIVECKKERSSYGPPAHTRISPEELERCFERYGFLRIDYADLGPNYLMSFEQNN